MEIKDLKKILIIAILVFLLIGLMFFRKDKPKEDKPADVPAIENPAPAEKPDIEKITKEKLQYEAESFSSIYYSFSWGKLSNVESLYGKMTDTFRQNEKSRIDSLKNGIKDQPVQYKTQRSAALNSEITSYGAEGAVVNVNLETSYFAGALVQKDTMVWVDSSGKKYNGNEFDLVYLKDQKTIELSLLKIGDEWKVDKINIKQ